ncbi:glutamyl-tRNA synthetase [Gillisia sp. Hel_I_29]|uniref:glutamyl-tRNA synthetase n=1 Tax=Gillisia sp. Hel_I_29 TaxID=1249975 RepID=UPI000551B629|nr:glutamyl-tRNA synthetase [Gillisia sp. Hel_I_29]
MNDFNILQNKLVAFIKRYYLNELLKGAILFISIWLFYFIAVLLLEYFFWLTPGYRKWLFFISIGVTIVLLYKFVAVPILKLFNLSKGIDLIDASKIIGKYFPEVNDKLLNVLQLQRSSEQSELLLASIAQRSKELKPVPFKLAVDFRRNLKYIKYAAFPLLLILGIYISGNISSFTESYSRVIDYRTAYLPPAPFSFYINQVDLKVAQGGDLEILVKVEGNVHPELASIHYNGQEYLLKNDGAGNFTFKFEGVDENIDFYISANQVKSLPYKIEVIAVPTLTDFEMKLEYPVYLKITDEILKGTGNAKLPEGTKVTWVLRAKKTDEVMFVSLDTSNLFAKEVDNFKLSQMVFADLPYKITTSNADFPDHETLDYNISVIKDQYPKIKIQTKRDSLNKEQLYFLGKATDDNGISNISMVYFIENQELKQKKVTILNNIGNIMQFPYAFPGNLEIEEGVTYNIYFEVIDNDAIHGGKKSRSQIISYKSNSENDKIKENLKEQQKSIENISSSLNNLKSSEEELKELSNEQKQQRDLNYNDQKKLDDFLKRQMQQSEMIENFTDKLKTSLDKSSSTSPENQKFKQDLQQRLERNEERLKENEALMKELEKYTEKISTEELAKKLENLAKQNKAQKRNIEQLLELTKRYYVQEKNIKLANDLEILAREQQKISESDLNNSKENQEKLSEQFDQFKKEMDSLEEENKSLKKPFDISNQDGGEDEITIDQKEAVDNLEQKEIDLAKKKQKAAAEKMKELSSKMRSSHNSQQAQTLKANVESLRQILDNLIKFSFEQEDLMLLFKSYSNNDPLYAKQLRRQQVLKQHFEHINDSLFALSLQNPMMTEQINGKLSDIDFNINKSLERLSENQIPQGTASQQYVMADTNELANMLGDILSNMEQQLNPSSGDGNDGEGIQLPDIIQSQQQLQQKMQLGMEKGEETGKDKNDDTDSKSGLIQEKLSGELFNIFKDQQELRKQLLEKFRENGFDKRESDLLLELEQIENDILDKGYNEETRKRMDNITHQLMELQNSELSQQEDSKRSSTSNSIEYNNNAKDQIDRAKEYFNSIDILNRQSLPLRQIYKTKVKEYFDARED